MGLPNNILSACHRLLARSKAATYIAAKIRNQCDLIVSRRFAAAEADPLLSGEYKLLRHILPHCAVYFDIGANKGEWTNYIIKNKNDSPGKFYLFEPGLGAFAFLQERYINHPNVYLKNLAVSDNDRTLTFYEEGSAGEMSSAVKGWANNATQTIQAPCTTVDLQMADLDIPFIDFIKIDAEGFDLKVITGAVQAISRQQAGFIQFEYNSAWLATGSSLLNAYSMLTAHNYKIYLVQPSGLMDYAVDIYKDFYSFANFLAVSPRNYPLVQHLII
jgi:FkbM family methyltransferase